MISKLWLAQQETIMQTSPPRRAPPLQYDPRVMLRVWDHLPSVPQSESACLVAWRLAAYPDPPRGDFPEGTIMRLLTAALASARSIAMTDKPSIRRPRGGAVKEILNQPPAAAPAIPESCTTP